MTSIHPDFMVFSENISINLYLPSANIIKMDMEGNSPDVILAEIKSEISSLQDRLEQLSLRVAEYEKLAAQAEPETAIEPEPAAEPEVPVTEPEVPAVPEEPIDISLDTDLPDDEAVPMPKGESVNEAVSHSVAKSVIDVMSEAYAWKTDMPGSPVKNIISAISLNDRVLFINTLFHEDPSLFHESIAAFNEMASISQAEDYIKERFPGWNMKSDVVYRFMMAVRRKLR